MKKDLIVREFGLLAERAPGSPLVVSPRETWSFGQIDALADVLERRLRKSGMPQGSGLAIAIPNGPGFLAAYIGALRAGYVVAPLDSKTPGPERLHVARSLQLCLIVSSEKVWPADDTDIHIDHVEPSMPDSAHRFDAAVSTIRLTSGSAGTPRGILVSSEALVADDRQLAKSMGLRDRERILTNIPFSHAYGFSSIVLPALIRGSTIVIPADKGPFAVIEAAHRCEVTFFPTVPAYLEALLRLERKPTLPSTLRLVVSAAAPLRPAAAVQFREIYQRPVHVFYGASECGGITFDQEGGSGERGSIGTPVDGVAVELESITTADKENRVVVVRSPSVALGYHPHPDTRLSNGCFRSQDLGTFREQELTLLGRFDDLINIRGKKVNPREVEASLGVLDGVKDAAVVGVNSSDAGGVFVRAVVATSDPMLSTQRVLDWCRFRLAAHKVPRSVILVDSVPRNARGKIDRRALMALTKRDR
jgi:long-chain acyl-CoA synthetase